jgi:hypothetical protein
VRKAQAPNAKKGVKRGAQKTYKSLKKPTLELPHLVVDWTEKLVWLLITLGITRGLAQRFYVQDTDSALFFNLLSTRSIDESKNQEFNNSFFDLIDLVQTGLRTSDTSYLKFNLGESVPLIQTHAYMLYFFIHSIPNALFDNFYFPFLLLAVSYVIGLKSLVNYFKLNRISLFGAGIFFCGVMFSPVFVGSLLGQNYLDRLFFGPAIYVLLNVTKPDKSRKSMISVALMALIGFCISERASLMMGVILIFSVFSIGVKTRTERAIFGSLGLLGISWYGLWNSKISDSFYASSVNIETLKQNFLQGMNGVRSPGLTIFIIANLSLLLLSFLATRYLFLTIISLVPNVLVSVGGAELTSFTSHYHALYLPILLVSAAIGTNKISSELLSNWLTKSCFILFFIGIVAFSNFVSVNPKPTDLNFSISKTIGKSLDIVGLAPKEISFIRQQAKADVEMLLAKIESDGVVAPPEIMPGLSVKGVKEIFFFPIGLGEKKNVIVSYLNGDLANPYVDTFGLVPPELLKVWGPIQQDLIHKHYLEVDRFVGSQKTYIVYELIAQT